ncbi:MAG: hypothetical protein JWP74_1864 [Marmoricola sp.]|nr:hypothetical protein [Marmoricola sp.]
MFSNNRGRSWFDERKRACLRVAVLVGSGVLVTLAVLSPAGASESFTMSGNVPGPHEGSARATGTLVFPSKYQVVWAASVRDVCPGDAHGVQLQFVVTHLDGSQSVKVDVLHDLNGCGNDSVTGTGAFTDRKRIKNVTAVLYSTNGASPWVILDLTAPEDNPRT